MELLSMDFLNRAAAQFNELFRSMTVSARITAALLLVVVVISLGYLFKVQSSGPDSYLLGGHPFSAAELPQVQGALAKAGLKDFEVEGNLIRIPRNEQAAYIAALADADLLPSSFGDRFMSIVERQSPFSSKYQNEQVLKHARNAMLAHSISRMEGIQSADVFTDVTDKRGLRPEQIASASVNVHTIGGQPLTAKQAQAIRSLVAGAITTLPREKVTVIDGGTGRTFAADTGDGSGSGLEDAYLNRKVQYEDKIQSDITSLLLYVPGVQVSVNVDLSKERSRREESQKFDPKPVIVRTSTDESQVSSESGAPGGRPGFDAQQPNRGAQLASNSRASLQRETRERSDTAGLASTDITRADYVGLTPERVSVAVVVPTTYLESIWRQMNPTPAGQEPKQPTPLDLAPIEEQEFQKIRNLVFNKLPHHPGSTAEELVAVSSFRPIPLPPPAEPGAAKLALGWLADSWSTLGMIGLAGFSLVVLRSIVKAPVVVSGSSAAPIVPASGLPMIAGTIGPEEGEEPASAKNRLRRRASGGPSLREDLVEIVREDPDAAANILKSWIGN
jgi:flagellar M-ring protein FliF